MGFLIDFNSAHFQWNGKGNPRLGHFLSSSKFSVARFPAFGMGDGKQRLPLKNR